MRVFNVIVRLVAALSSSSAQVQDVTWLTGSSLTTWHAISAPSVCILDLFHFGVRFSAFPFKPQDVFKWQLIARRVKGWRPGTIVASDQLKVAPLTRKASEQKAEKESDKLGEEGLKCAVDAEFCIPKLVGIRLPNVDTKNLEGSSLLKDHSIVLNFELSTNQPDANTKDEIDGWVMFTEYIGDELEGTWSDDGRELVIRIKDIDAKRVKPMREFMQGLLHTTIVTTGKEASRGGQKTNMYMYEGLQNLRIELDGVYAIGLLLHDKVILWSPEVSVVPCDTSFLVLNPMRATAHSTEGIMGEALNDIKPSYAIDGVLTHGGEEAFMLPHTSFHIDTPGSWSLTFWVFLIEDSTGNFRTLFFNGNGENQQRTPSAWWKPNERRLVLRVSTINSADIGLESNGELPLNEWVYMGFTFVNCSDATTHEACPSKKSNNSWYYSYSLYIDGLLDTEVHVHEPVIANTGPLYIGKGPWTDGMRGFTSNLKVFSAPISSEEHRKLYFSKRHLHKNFTDCRPNLAFEAEMKDPAMQISYLSQCFDSRSNYLDRSSDYNNDFAPGKLISVTDLCDPDAWDLLVEAADNGHPTACREVGQAYLYGVFEARHQCSASVSVRQNLTLAGKFLAHAFRRGVYSTGKSLALLLAVASETEMFDGDHLDLLSTGLLHFAAASGEKDAFAMLGHRYSIIDVEIATYCYRHAADEAAKDYHQLGKQPLHEMTRLYDSYERDITVGERGDDDELIQFQKLRADRGDVEAMVAMGDLYYWGAHGVSRDHEQAYKYFHRAATAGDVNAQSAVAGMLLKGEGIAQDNLTAIEWYEKASGKNHTRALNGLGFIHFHGRGGVAENKTLALEYFERATANGVDGDSIYNAGHCHAMGLGTSANISRAMQYFELAASKFGHFDAIFKLGKIYYTGVPLEVSRDCKKALEYLKAASNSGQWGYVVRRGFTLYTNSEFERAAVVYHEARELGYPVATSNLAFLYDQHLLQQGSVASERRALKYLLLADKENGDKETLVRIGDYHYYGLAGLRQDPVVAFRWYSRASAEDVAVGAFNVGQMYEFGDGVEAHLERAHRYYNRALKLAAENTERRMAIHFALARLVIRSWLHTTFLDKILGLGGSILKSSDVATDSTGMFHATMSYSAGVFFMLITTVAIFCFSIGWWYFHFK